MYIERRRRQKWSAKIRDFTPSIRVLTIFAMSVFGILLIWGFSRGPINPSDDPSSPAEVTRRLMQTAAAKPATILPSQTDGVKRETASLVPPPPEETAQQNLDVPDLPTPYPLEPKSPDTDIILVMMASYRDNDCHVSILSAFEEAANPDRLRFAIYQQHDPIRDYDCMNFTAVCPGHVACSRTSQVNVKRVHYTEAKGPTYGRAMHDKMVGDDEIFALQIDSHMTFVPQWDTRIITMWMSLNNSYAVITTYVRDIKTSRDPTTRFGKDTNIVIVCNTLFKGGHGMPRHSTGGIVKNPLPDKSSAIMVPVWCAGLSFSAAHRVRDVPNDPFTPHIFDGEEFIMTAKLWTHGYDFYTPAHDIVFHPYGRHIASKTVRAQPLYQQINPQETSRAAKTSSARIRHVLGMPPAPDLVADLTNISQYSVGKTRSLEYFYEVRKINIQNLTVETICPSITSGDFHRRFQVASPQPYRGPET